MIQPFHNSLLGCELGPGLIKQWSQPAGVENSDDLTLLDHVAFLDEDSIDPAAVIKGKGCLAQVYIAK